MFFSVFDIIKTNIILQLKTGNIFFDMLSSMLTISLIGYIINEKDKFKNFIKLLFTYFSKTNEVQITYVAKEYGSYNYSLPKTDYSKSYLALLHYINTLDSNKNRINCLKEISNKNDLNNIKDDDKNEEENENTILNKNINNIIYTIDQHSKFAINSDINCKIINNIKDDNNNNKKDNAKRDIKIHELILFSNTKNLEYIKKFTLKCCEEYDNYLQDINNKVQYYETYVSTDRDGYQTFDEYIFDSNRTFDNIIFDKKKDIINRINYFTENKEWYNRRGIPYTLGLMLYGDPGCGKTSFVKALANHTKRHIIDIPLSRIKTCRELQNVFFKIRINNKEIPYNKRILIFEDLDCVSDIVESRENKELNNSKKIEKIFLKNLKKKSSDDENHDSHMFSMTNSLITSHSTDDKITLSFILNLIDGILEMPGRILIVTTNYPEKLDKALIRPGRIDLKIHFQKASVNMIKELFNQFYELDINIDDKILIKIDRKYTPAEILQICNKYPFSFENSLNELLS